MTMTLFQDDEAGAVKEARLARLTMEYHLVIKHHRHSLGKEPPSDETVNALQACGLVVFSHTYPALGLTTWHAMDRGQHRRSELLARERKIIADELQAPALYAGLVEDIATGSPSVTDPDVQSHGDRLHALAEEIRRDLETRQPPRVCGQVPSLAPDTAEPARRTA